MVMARILDQYGNPIDAGAVREAQTSRLVQLHQQFPEHPLRGLTPQRLRAILTDAERGVWRDQLDLFEDLEEFGGHLVAEMGKRRRALTRLTWDIVPPLGASAAESAHAEFAREVITAIPGLEDVILDMTDAIGKGFACLEMVWATEGREWRPASIAARPQRWFRLDRATRSEIRLDDGGGDGQPLNPAGWIVHRHPARSGYLSRGALYRIAAWPTLVMAYAVRDFAEFLEIHGLPLRLGKYPVGATEEEKRTLYRAVVGIGHAAAGIIPDGMMVEFKEATAGTHDPFLGMIAWAERSISKLILGGTLTSQADGQSSTNALGNVHNEVRQELRDADAQQIAATLTRELIWPIIAFNRGASDPRRSPRWVFDTAEPEDLALYAEALPKLVDLGMRIPVSFAHQRLQIPRAERGEDVLMPGAAAPGTSPVAGGAARLAAARLGGEDTDLFPGQAAIDTAIDELPAEDLQAMVDQVLEPLMAMLREGVPLEQIREQLARDYPLTQSPKLVEALSRAIFVSMLWGRVDAGSRPEQ